METGEIFKLSNRFSKLMDEYHDCLIGFEVETPDTIIVNSLEGGSPKRIFKIKLNGLAKESFTIYENLDENDRLHYEITDCNEIEDIENCFFEMIDVYASSRDLLITGAKLEKGRYGNDVVLEIFDIDHIEI